MSTDETLAPGVDKRKSQLVRLIIASGWFLSMATMVGIIWACIYLLAIKGATDLPDVLKQWGSLALGFLFGGFANIVKDYVTDAP